MTGGKYKAMGGISADTVNAVANWILVAALILGMLATYAIVVSGNIKEQNLKRELAKAATEAAKANERAASLEKEAADARLETEKVKKELAWRGLSGEQMFKLLTVLRAKPGAVGISYTVNDPEAQNFAMQLASIFTAAKWSVSLFGGTYGGHLWFGLIIPDPIEDNAEDVATVRAAFAAISMGYNITPLPRWTSAVRGGDFKEGPRAQIYIGSKQPMLFTK